MRYFSWLSSLFFSHQLLMFICVGLSIFVGLIMFIFLFSKSYNTIFYSSFFLEFFWTFIPSVLVGIMLFPLFFQIPIWTSSFDSFFVIASQWYWSGDGVFTNFALEERFTVILHSCLLYNVFTTSTDVLHALKIPALYSMTDAVPGALGSLCIYWVLPGLIFGTCGQICGDSHSNMPLLFMVC